MGQEQPKYHVTDEGKVFVVNDDGSFTDLGNAESRAAKPDSQASPLSAKLNIRFAGYWGLGPSIQILVNGCFKGEYSFNHPFEATFDVPPGAVDVVAKLSMRKAVKKVKIQCGQAISLQLTYSRLWGTLKFKEIE